MSFIDKIKNTLNNDMNVSITENSALGYRTTGKNLLDLHFAVATLRSASEMDIINRFIKAYFDDKKTALKWLFYVRDIRGGLGERRFFRTVFNYLAKNNSNDLPIRDLIELVPEYGRYDDLFDLLDTVYCDTLIEIIRKQLAKDLEAKNRNESVSLLAKWLPSVNTTSEKSRARGRLIASKLSMSERDYRKTLSELRRYLDVVERKMSADQFGEIDYESVPSKANLIYKNAFLRHDEERRKAYLESLQRGEAKIHAGVLHPHEIIHAYMSGYTISSYDETLEQLWKALPNTVEDSENSIVVADGSGSMLSEIGGGSSCSALSVANALAIYFAERSSGQFKDQYITFSMNPQIVDLSKGSNLHDKLMIALSHSEVANTDIYRVFQLILRTAIKHKMEQSELPKNVIIVSDMEFDYCAANASERLFTQIARDFASHGYKLPRLVFWNVNSRTETIPVKENALGVALVSGFSANIFKMVLSNELDPYKCLLDTVNDERYEAVERVLNAYNNRELKE